MYAVFDTETTGISAAMGHRVIEIAVVLVDEDGRVEDTWSTLLHPDRDLGPQHIHGIKARQVLDATSPDGWFSSWPDARWWRTICRSTCGS